VSRSRFRKRGEFFQTELRLCRKVWRPSRKTPLFLNSSTPCDMIVRHCLYYSGIHFQASMIFGRLLYLMKSKSRSEYNRLSQSLKMDATLFKEWIILNWLIGYKYYLEYKNAEEKYNASDSAPLLLQQQEQLATI
jgi:hypothetical protein